MAFMEEVCSDFNGFPYSCLDRRQKRTEHLITRPLTDHFRQSRKRRDVIAIEWKIEEATKSR